MKMIIFGATGKTGRELLLQGLEQGHEVTAFVRNPDKLNMEHPSLHIVQGEATSYDDVKAALAEKHYDAVFSALGAKSPFQRDLRLVEAVRHITRAAAKQQAGKLVHISFVGTREDAGKLGLLYRWVTPLLMRNLLADHRDKEQIVSSGAANWVIVQPPILTSGERTRSYYYETTIRQLPSSKLKMSRANLAQFMLKQAQQSEHDRKAVMVSE
ncbi:NAD(P)-dependent oxidoreductase [Paenibacillus hunanensis]|uniref:NADH-flavin reductase n=1 Tax=Paenibacillus hunanensis TaxID=539262 RepID=A0ABU1ITG2_9BACL|nr:NAD(P)H-binding protein [Paenibacillus hunanensis]MDR6242464.1 putative NADH-flavin reductase [Paenibacillus hunanensis]GGJ08016.1 NAD-dependent epimerase [Paenibacillus hunanensis]